MDSYIGQDMLYTLEIISDIISKNGDDSEVLMACDTVTRVINEALEMHFPEADKSKRDYNYKLMRANVILTLIGDVNSNGKQDVNLQNSINIVRQALNTLKNEKGRK